VFKVAFGLDASVKMSSTLLHVCQTIAASCWWSSSHADTLHSRIYNTHCKGQTLKVIFEQIVCGIIKTKKIKISAQK